MLTDETGRRWPLPSEQWVMVQPPGPLHIGRLGARYRLHERRRTDAVFDQGCIEAMDGRAESRQGVWGLARCDTLVGARAGAVLLAPCSRSRRLDQPPARNAVGMNPSCLAAPLLLRTARLCSWDRRKGFGR